MEILEKSPSEMTNGELTKELQYWQKSKPAGEITAALIARRIKLLMDEIKKRI